MLWACLHFSDLPLRAIFDDSAFDDGDEAQPCVVVDGPQQRQHLVYLNAAARHAGLRADQPLAAAPVPAAARTFALRHDGFFVDQREPMLAALGNVPLAYSGLSENAITLLYKVGLRTLREAFALPRPEFALRSGPATLAALDRLRGIDTEILALYRPPDRF